MPIAREILDMLELGRKPSNFSCPFRSKIAKVAKDKCSHCAMDLDYCFRWLLTAIALWAHPLMIK